MNYIIDIPKLERNYFDDGYLRINFIADQVTVADREIKLTHTEYKLLTELVLNTGKVLGYDELLIRVWGFEYKGAKNILHRHISRLHQKIEPIPEKPRYIINVVKVGYRFEFNPREH